MYFTIIKSHVMIESSKGREMNSMMKLIEMFLKEYYGEFAHREAK